jgi:dTDP-4-dehydrorhamnose reductase
MKKILILGTSGMAGHVIWNHLKSLGTYRLFGTSQSYKISSDIIKLDVKDSQKLADVITQTAPEYIINCIGVLIKGANSNPENAIYINAYLPHQLSGLATNIGAKLLHISTDCVFSGKKGAYTEVDYKDGMDVYAQTKALGEVINDIHLTIRTSIIGPELKENGEGLFDWFMRQKGEIYGFKEAYWSGVTTLELAKAIDMFIKKDITGLYHLTAENKVSKFELLKLFKEIWNVGAVSILPFDGKKVDKSLIDTRKELPFTVKPYQIMLRELRDYMAANAALYSKYNRNDLQ